MFFEIPIAAAAIALVVGILFAALGWVIHDEVARYRRHGTRYDGEVVEIRVRRGSDDATSYEPVFAFRDATGATLQASSLIASSAYHFAIGTRHPILHIPGGDKVLMADRAGGRILAFMFMGMGGAATLVGCVGLAGWLTG